jgi:heme A synthase
VILWGAGVRATGSGAGCGSHWPLCNGEVVPRAPGVATVIEFTHRATSGVALLAVVGLVVAAFRLRPRGDATRRAAVWSLVFILTEAAVGAGLVLFELVAENASMARALFGATHLVNTFLLLAALTLTAHRASAPDGAGDDGAPSPPPLLGYAALVLLLLVGMSGAVAALGDTLYPAASLGHAFAQDVSPTAHVLLRLRLLHPLLAVAGALAAAGAAARTRAAAPESGPRARAVIGLAVLELVIGGVNVILLAPVWMQVVHLLVADLLWIALVRLTAPLLARRGDSAAARSGAALPVR